MYWMIGLFVLTGLFVQTAYGVTKYGAELTLREVTKVSDISDKPDRYVGKRVLVEGMVVEVCAKRGCWLNIASDRKYEKIQIKVTDGEIVFPMSARGRKALVEGVVEEISMSREEAVAYERHKAEEKGEPFDPSTVTGPRTIYRIRGMGATLED